MAKLKLLSESALSKKYENSGRADILLPEENLLYLPSRCLSINWLLGGGLVYGRIAEVFGYESTGKSLIGLDFAAACQALNGIVLWGDIEGTFTNNWAKQNGVDPTKVYIYGQNDIEGFSDWTRDYVLYLRSILKKNEPILIVCDSIAALETLDNMNNDQMGGKAEMGNRAKSIYRFYRYRSNFFQRMGVCVLMINQVRKKVGATMFEAAETTPGGDSTRFYCSQRISLVPSKQIKGKVIKGKFEPKDDGQKVGRNVYLQIAKNKISPPKNSIKTQVYFVPLASGYVGYSRYHGLPEILVELGVVKKQKSGGYYYKDKMIARGEDSFLKVLQTDEEFRKRLLRRSGINSISKTRAHLEGMPGNIFKVKAKADESE